MENMSHKTARHRSELSAPMREMQSLVNGRSLDYGCGKGTDADLLGLDKYDLYYNPDRPVGKYDVIFCNYVLCVVPEEEEGVIVDDIRSLLKDDGVAYISVRRDKKNLNGWTKIQTYQRLVELDEEVHSEVKGRYIIYKVTK